MANVNFGYGTKANYDKLTTKDANTLYFITDTRQIFKGTDEYTKSCKLSACKRSDSGSAVYPYD